MVTLRPYAKQCSEILHRVAADGKTKNPLFVKREETKICYVLVVGNRGLCGMYNSALLSYAKSRIEQEAAEVSVVTCGRWGKETIAATEWTILRAFDEIGDTPTSAQAQELADYLKELYLTGKADKIVLVYQHYQSAISQLPVSQVLLPVMPSDEENTSAGVDYICEPGKDELLNGLMEMYLQNVVYSCLLEAKTGEHAARLNAMTAASDNSEDLIRELNQKLNHLRQSAITTEISEIIGGANALADLQH